MRRRIKAEARRTDMSGSRDAAPGARVDASPDTLGKETLDAIRGDTPVARLRFQPIGPRRCVRAPPAVKTSVEHASFVESGVRTPIGCRVRLQADPPRGPAKARLKPDTTYYGIVNNALGTHRR